MLKQTLINNEEHLITHESQLTEIFFSGCKTRDIIAQKRVGLEFEKLPVCKKDLKAASYQEIAKFLTVLKNNSRQWTQGVYEDKALLGLVSDDGVITLEPGSQTELSLKPLKNIDTIAKILQNYNKVTAELAQEHGIIWLGCGIQPVSTYRNINIIPKKRYEYMTKYLPSVAKKPLVMMRETAGIQVGIDYSSEEDAMNKLKLASLRSPFMTAMFANSPIRGGVETGYKSFRALSWLNTDNDRCGFVGQIDERFSFEEYIDYVLQSPMIFINRESGAIPVNGKINFAELKKFFGYG